MPSTKLLKITLLALLLLTPAITKMFSKRYTKKKDVYGRHYHEHFDESTNTTHHIVDASIKQHPLKMLENLYKHHEENPAEVRKTNITQCQPGQADFFKFLSLTVAKLTEDMQKVENESFCFKKVRFYFVKDSYNDLTLFVSSHGKKDLACTDTYMITSGGTYHFVTVAIPGVQMVSFKNLVADDVEFIQLNGLQIFRFCDSVINFIPNILLTASLFIGGLGLNPDIPFFGSHVPMYMQKMNVEFIKHGTGYQWLPRDPPRKLDYKAENFRSGDFLAIIRFDGVDNIIGYGSGSRVGHSVMALWDREVTPPQLYIVESQDGWYWPTHGLQKTKWEQWIKWADNADFNVAHLRLRDEFQSKFDETKAWAWFNKTEGMPYGYRNFLFSWIDTPKSNLPPILDLELAFTLFKVLESVAPSLDTDRLLKEALNWRIGTKNLTLKEVQQHMMRNNMTIGDVFAMPEQDEIMYSDGYSYVCSAYVTSFYKKTGMLGDIDIQATEFTPRDLYMLGVYENDGNWKNADCKNDDPESPWCQVIGHWKMEFPGYNTIVPYSKMNERCPSVPPLFIRPDGC